MEKEASRRHVFYHADRSASLKEGQKIELDENRLSRFGAAYFSALQTKAVQHMNDVELRELYLEEIRKKPQYSLYESRLQSMFAALTIEDAIVFGNSIVPKPDHPIPIFEILTDRFWTLDSNWLDYKCDIQQQIDYYWNYWDGRITNHCPQVGERRPPRLEIMIALPATAGKIVHIIE